MAEPSRLTTTQPGAARRPATPRALLPGPPSGLRGRWRRLPRWARVTAVVLLVPALLFGGACSAAVVALRAQYAGDPRPDAVTRHRDAVWLGHAWVDGRKGPADVAALAARLRGTGIRDLYVHSGPLEHDGSLPASDHPRAGWLLGEVHRVLPGVRVQAWLGDLVAPEHPEALHMDRPQVRARIAQSARQVVAAGFAGVHLDLEPVHSGDRGFLAVLDEVRAAISPQGAVLSVATPKLDPLSGVHVLGAVLPDHPTWWPTGYFREVARRVDQVAVMSYDTGMPAESLYGGYLARETSLALQATPGNVDLLMGLPAYWEDNFDHWGDAETVSAAVRGVRLGLSRTEPGRQRFGVALYVDFTATERDWAAYRDGWVQDSRTG